MVRTVAASLLMAFAFGRGAVADPAPTPTKYPVELIPQIGVRGGADLTADTPAVPPATADPSPSFGFAVDAFRKHCLMNGLDDIGLTLQHADAIRAFEATDKAIVTKVVPGR